MELEEWCRDVFPSSSTERQQRVNYFAKLESSTVLDEAYKSICATTPPSTEVDGTKFSKFMREIELFPESQRRAANTHIDLAFTRQVAKRKAEKDNETANNKKSNNTGNTRCVDMEGFCHAVMEVRRGCARSERRQANNTGCSWPPPLSSLRYSNSSTPILMRLAIVLSS